MERFLCHESIEKFGYLFFGIKHPIDSSNNRCRKGPTSWKHEDYVDTLLGIEHQNDS